METETIDADQAEQERQERTAQAMRDAGVSTEETMQVDYFGFEDTERVMLPDGKSYVEISALNEGGRRRYLNKVNREVTIAKQTGDAKMQLANGDERMILLMEAIVGWNLVRATKKGGDPEPVRFTDSALRDFLTNASPRVIDIIDKQVREQNDWLMNDVTLEDLLKQRDELDEQIEKKKAEEEGKAS